MLQYLERLQRSSLPVPERQGGVVVHRQLALEALDSRCMLSAATDAAGLSAVLQSGETASEIDTAPIFSPLAPISIAPGATARIQVTATDTTSQQLFYSLDPGAPAGASINQQTGLLTWDVPPTFTPGAVRLTVRATEAGSQGLSAALPVVLNVETKFNGFDLFTTGAVQLGGFAQGLAVDNGVIINGGLTISPFGSSLPGGLPAQVAALVQLAGIPPIGTPSTDLGIAGHLAAGIVDMVLGFDAGVPHNTDGMVIEELARESGNGGGAGLPGAPGEIQKAGATEPINADESNAAPRDDSTRLHRTVPVPADNQYTSREASFWGPATARWRNPRATSSTPQLLAATRLAAANSGDHPGQENYEEHARLVKRSAAAAALMMPLLVADLPEKREQARHHRFCRLLGPVRP
ncbi:MAG TPA: Ig domain-containing protein [Pirellulales bacterium]|jgi:hypothetical protein